MTPQSHHPRVLVHGHSVGGITKADIERRAQELAIIRRGSEEYTDDDLNQAGRELLGTDRTSTPSEDLNAGTTITRDPRDPPLWSNGQTPDFASEDESVEAERLALQGVDEAQHDQMLAARRRRNRDEDF